MGVAYESNLSVIRLINSYTFDALEAAALTYKYHDNWIYNLSWGPADDGKTVEGPGKLVNSALKDGSVYGRNGRGNLYVLASGNGGRSSDACGADGYANSIYTITVGAIDERNNWPNYAEHCAAQLITSLGGNNLVGIQTTDISQLNGVVNPDAWTDSHYGTSAAAPFVSGSLALLLQKYPNLGWRDVQNILVRSATQLNSDDQSWITNGAGLHVSSKFGFGVLQADKMFELLQRHQNFSISLPQPSLFEHRLNDPVNIKSSAETVVEIQVDQPAVFTANSAPFELEHVELEVNLKHGNRGKIQIGITSPSNTTSILLHQRPLDTSSDGLKNWQMLSVQQWGEISWGKWRVVIKNDLNQTGTLESVKLRLRGVPCPREQYVITDQDSYKQNKCPWEIEYEKKSADAFSMSAIATGVVLTIVLGILIYLRKRNSGWRLPFSKKPRLPVDQYFPLAELEETVITKEIETQRTSPGMIKSPSTDNLAATRNQQRTLNNSPSRPQLSIQIDKTVDLGLLPSPQASNPLATPRPKMPSKLQLAVDTSLSNGNGIRFDATLDEPSPKSPNSKQRLLKKSSSTNKLNK